MGDYKFLWNNPKNKSGKNTGKTPIFVSFTILKGVKLYVADGIVFGLNQIIKLAKLRITVIKAAYSLGHLGTANILVFRKNKMVKYELCYECQVTT